jgi:hypothetical protein
MKQQMTGAEMRGAGRPEPTVHQASRVSGNADSHRTAAAPVDRMEEDRDDHPHLPHPPAPDDLPRVHRFAGWVPAYPGATAPNETCSTSAQGISQDASEAHMIRVTITLSALLLTAGCYSGLPKLQIMPLHNQNATQRATDIDACEAEVPEHYRSTAIGSGQGPTLGQLVVPKWRKAYNKCLEDRGYAVVEEK